MQLFANNAATTLAGAIGTGTLTMQVKLGEGAKFPAPTGGDFFLVTLCKSAGGLESDHEIVKCTARSGDVLTIVRAQEGTTAKAFVVDDVVSARVTAQTMEDLDVDTVKAKTSVTAPSFVGALTGNASTATTAGTVTTAAQPSITSVGTLTGLTVTAPIAGSVTGSAATVTAAAQPAITSVGTLTGLTVTATITGSVSGSAASATTATNATNTAITNDTATAVAVYPTWVTANTGNLGQKTTSTKLSFVPSTGILTATGFSGPLTGNVTGNASTATTAGNVTGTVAVANGGTGATDAATARSNLGAASVASVPLVTSATPAMDGVANVGIDGGWARGDHVHPSDTSRAPLASPTFTGTVTAPTFSGALSGNATTATSATNVTGTVAVANGGTGATTAATARSNLGAAPLASPALTGTPTAPTATADTNTTQLATTAFVQAAVSSVLTKSVAGGVNVTLTAAEAAAPIIILTGALTASIQLIVPTAGNHFTILNRTSGAYSVTIKTAAGAGVIVTQGKNERLICDGVDVIPALTDFDSISMTGTPTAPTAAVNTNSTQVASTAFVLGQAATVAPVMNGAAAVGTSTTFARGDHVHATDTSRAPLASPTFTGTVTAPTFSGALSGNATNVTGTVAVGNGGTGATTAALALTNLGAAPVANPTFTGTVTAPTFSGALTGNATNVTGVVAIGNGGTGANTAAGALTALGGAPLASPTFTGTVTAPTFSGALSGNATNVTGIVAGVNGGTGVANTGKTITLGGNLTTAGAFASTFTMTATTAVTFPTSGTLLSTAAAVTAAQGGTGLTSYAVGDLVYASGATTLAKLADVASGNVLLSGGVGGAPTYGKVGLTTHVTGTLPLANGGTGGTDAATARTSLGLGNVDNTSDANKPVSTAQLTALNLKADKSDTYTKAEVDGKASSATASFEFAGGGTINLTAANTGVIMLEPTQPVDLFLPDATTMGSNRLFIIKNASVFTAVVFDKAGGAICTIAGKATRFVWCSDIATVGGEWVTDSSPAFLLSNSKTLTGTTIQGSIRLLPLDANRVLVYFGLAAGLGASAVVYDTSTGALGSEVQFIATPVAGKNYYPMNAAVIAADKVVVVLSMDQHCRAVILLTSGTTITAGGADYLIANYIMSMAVAKVRDNEFLVSWKRTSYYSDHNRYVSHCTVAGQVVTVVRELLYVLDNLMEDGWDSPMRLFNVHPGVVVQVTYSSRTSQCSISSWEVTSTAITTRMADSFAEYASGGWSAAMLATGKIIRTTNYSNTPKTQVFNIATNGGYSSGGAINAAFVGNNMQAADANTVYAPNGDGSSITRWTVAAGTDVVAQAETTAVSNPLPSGGALTAFVAMSPNRFVSMHNSASRAAYLHLKGIGK